MDEGEVAAFLRERLTAGMLRLSCHFNRRNVLPERRFTTADILRALREEPLILEGGLGKWLAVNRIGERHITVVFVITSLEEVVIVTAYPSKGWETAGYRRARRA